MSGPGTLDVAELYVGPPRSGKSYALSRRTRELQRELGAYVIAHDVAGTFDGPGVRHHQTEDDVRRGLRTHPGAIHALVARDGSAAVRLALEASKAVKESGLRTPVVLALDEARLVPGMSAQNLAPDVAEGWVMRRHYRLAFLIGSQFPNLVHPDLWGTATMLTMYRIDSERIHSSLVHSAGVPAELVARLPQLELPSVDQLGTPRVEGRHYVVFKR